MKTNSIWSEFVPTIGRKLYRLAVSLSRLPDEPMKKTVKAEALAIKGRKRLSQAATIEGVFDAQRAMREHRRNRYAFHGVPRIQRAKERCGHYWQVDARCNGWSTLGTRLENFKSRRFKAAIKRTLLTGVRGHDRIYWVDDPKDVGVSVETWTEWEKVGQSTYPHKHTRRDFHIPRMWGTRVLSRDLESVDGLLTLDADEVSSPVDGVRLFAARWLEHARGYDVHLHTGFIAMSGSYAYHGADMRRALAGLNRKRTLAKTTPEVKEALAQKRREARAKALVARCGTVAVTMEDSEAVGNCDYGTRSWCHAVGIDPDKGATLATVVDGYLQRPQPEAWSVISHVARTHTT